MEKYLEIEKIVNHKTENDTRLFQVKFKGCEVYAWLPLTDPELGVPCQNLILNYCLGNNVTIRDLPLLSVEKRAQDLFYALSNVSEDVLNQFAQRFTNMVLPESQLDCLMRELVKVVDVKVKLELSNKKIEQLRERAITEKCIQLRKEQLETLQRREWKYNTFCNNKAPIILRNNIDFSVPTDFVYINENVPSEGITIQTVPSSFFGCGNPLNPKKQHKCNGSCACMKLYEAKPAYDEHGLLINDRVCEIHECNHMCSCSYDCRYRVVQRGSTVPVLIFRTANGCGWGLKTLEFLPKGKFVGLYVGKVIYWEEGEKLPSPNGRTEYLFDIDYNKEYNGHSKYTIDAYKYGNFTRFINHSCDSNLKPYNIWINSLDKDIHEIGFFTSRSVDVGEELTFSYRSLVKDVCNCGSFKCSARKK